MDGELFKRKKINLESKEVGHSVGYQHYVAAGPNPNVFVLPVSPKAGGSKASSA